MSDDEFREIFKNNNLGELFGEISEDGNEEPETISLTIKGIQEGLAEITALAAGLSAFLVEYYSAYEEDRLDEAPKLTVDAITYLIEIFQFTELFLDEVDVDSDEDDED